MVRRFITDQGFSFSGKAIATISGGQIVKAISGATVLTGTNEMTNVIEVDLADAAADSLAAVGVALSTVISGQRVGVQTAGVIGLYAAGAVGPGSPVYADGAVATADAVNVMGNTSNSGFQLLFGRALSTAASGQGVAVRLY